MNRDGAKRRGITERVQFKFVLSFCALLAGLIVLLNTYPIAASRDLVASEKESSLLSQASVISSSLSTLSPLEPESVGQVMDLLELSSGKETLTHDQECQYLTRVGLCAADYIDREVDASLSGGEVKRIEIATILARNADLMIFDEPEAGIDLWSFARLTETFRQLHDERGATLVVISHQERIIDLADEIVLVSDGVIAQHGPKEEVFPQILANTVSGCSYMKEA